MKGLRTRVGLELKLDMNGMILYHEIQRQRLEEYRDEIDVLRFWDLKEAANFFW